MSVESEAAAAERREYRPLSALAVVGLVLGVCSPLGFVSPLLVVVPLAAAVVSGLALHKISSAEQNLSGAAVAGVGLALALVFGVASVARGQARQFLYARQTRAVVEPWLEQLFRGDYRRAVEDLSAAAVARLQSASPGNDMRTDREQLLAERLSQDPSIRALVGLTSATARSQLVQTTCVRHRVAVTPSSTMLQAFCTYQIKNNRGQQLLLALELVRPPRPGKTAPWVIDTWQLVNSSNALSE